MKFSQRSCPVRHDSRFFSLCLCEGCVKAGCPQSEAASAETPVFGTAWPSVLREAVYAERENCE